jgi:hypothetical protein
MPNLLILPVVVIMIFVISLMMSKSKRINRIISKKSEYHKNINIQMSDEEFDKIIYKLLKEFKYRIEYIKKEDNVYVLSDKANYLYTYGFYYLIEAKENDIEIYLIPKFHIELNKFGLFESRMEKLAALIQVAKAN